MKNWIKEWQTYKRLIAYARPYVWRLIVGGIFGVVYGLITYFLLKGTKDVLREVFQNASFRGVVLFALFLPLLALIRSVGQFLSDYYIQWVGNRVVMDLRVATFSHLQELSIRFFTKSKTGDLMSRTINDSMMIDRAVSVVLGDLVKEPFTFLAAVVYLFWIDPLLAFVSLTLFPICILPIAMFGKRVRRYARHGQERMASLTSIMQETVVGTRIVKAFGMEQYEIERFTEQCRYFFNRIMRVVRDKAIIEPLIVFISTVGLALVLVYARWKNMPAENFITFAMAMIFLYEPVKKLSKVHLNIQQTSASADRIFEILDTPVLISDSPNAAPLDETIESICFDHVSFAYDGPFVLQDINLVVPAGERVAIVGSSGAGKTSLVNLLPRFYDVSKGALKINDVDIRNFTVRSLRSRIGMVTQETILFNDTVAANIAYGHSEASRSSIEEAARRAHAHEFVQEMPEGYETIIGERGVRLSGGQCQRLAIARAILRNPPLLILDEATSALDTESERLVQAALDDLMEGRTVFAIAHRLSTIMHCDKIIVLAEGRIVEIGPHEELLAMNGLYRRLYDMQFANIEA